MFIFGRKGGVLLLGGLFFTICYNYPQIIIIFLLLILGYFGFYVYEWKTIEKIIKMSFNECKEVKDPTKLIPFIEICYEKNWVKEIISNNFYERNGRNLNSFLLLTLLDDVNLSLENKQKVKKFICKLFFMENSDKTNIYSKDFATKFLQQNEDIAQILKNSTIIQDNSFWYDLVMK